MNAVGLAIALSIAAVIGLLFGLAPGLDIEIARPFRDIVRHGNEFGLRIDPTIMTLRNSGMWVVTALVAPAVLAFALKLVRPRRNLLLPGRAVLFLVVTLLLAPGLLVNGVLKEHWGRPRPIDVSVLGGSDPFVAWWDPRGPCTSNCSFVSGDVSAAFWTLAPAALAPPPWRALAYAGALVFGAGMSLMRMAAGAHFLTDVVFAGIFTFLVIWIVHGLVYRWRATRISDAAVERAIERMALSAHDFVLGLFRRRQRRPGG
jgi:lipid A 4'-phosphatase